jgi:hypothetical protein
MQNVQENCFAKQVKSANLCLFNCQLNYISCECTKPVKCIRINKNLFLASNSKPQGCYSVGLSAFFLSFCLCLGFSLNFCLHLFFVCLSLCLFVCLPFYLSQSVCLYIHIYFVYLSLFLPLSRILSLSLSHT